MVFQRRKFGKTHKPFWQILAAKGVAFALRDSFEVAKSLGRLSEGRTTLTIAHRLSSIRNSDRILVLTHDGIVEEGNHEELLEKHGIYDQFYRMANELK